MRTARLDSRGSSHVRCRTYTIFLCSIVCSSPKVWGRKLGRFDGDRVVVATDMWQWVQSIGQGLFHGKEIAAWSVPLAAPESLKAKPRLVHKPERKVLGRDTLWAVISDSAKTADDMRKQQNVYYQCNVFLDFMVEFSHRRRAASYILSELPH